MTIRFALIFGIAVLLAGVFVAGCANDNSQQTVTTSTLTTPTTTLSKLTTTSQRATTTASQSTTTELPSIEAVKYCEEFTACL